MIVDAHAHIFDEFRGLIAKGQTRSSHGGLMTIGAGEPVRFLPPMAGKTSFSAETLLAHMDGSGVDRAVLLQGPFYGDQNPAVAAAVRRWPDRFTGALFLDPRAPDAPETLRRACEEWGLHVIKLEMSASTGLCGLYPDLRLDGEELDWIFQFAREQAMVITLDLGAAGEPAYQTSAVRILAEQFPTLKFVIAHVAQPPLDVPQDETRARLWREQVALAKLPNVWLDLAALPHYSGGEAYPYPSVQEVIRQAVNLVGSAKLLWGTDVPALLATTGYAQLLGLVQDHCSFLPARERAHVLGENACGVYGC